MPRRALGFAGGVFDLAHLVEVDERIEVLERDPGEGAPDREPLPFEAARRDRDAADGPLARDGGIRVRDPGQDGDVVDDDGWHGDGSFVSTICYAKVVALSTTSRRVGSGA